MLYKGIYETLCMAYRIFLRPLVKEKVDDPNAEWDDVLMSVLDALFRYVPENK